MNSNKKNFLRLAWDYAAKRISESEKNSKEPSIQMELFTQDYANSILVIYFSDIDARSFSEAIHTAHPAFIIDMRTNPRFDLDGYSRSRAFSDFRDIGSTYVDYAELLGQENRTKNSLLKAAEDFIDKNNNGPFVFILGRKDQDAIYEEELIEHLPVDKKQWKLAVMP